MSRKWLSSAVQGQCTVTRNERGRMNASVGVRWHTSTTCEPAKEPIDGPRETPWTVFTMERVNHDSI